MINEDVKCKGESSEALLFIHFTAHQAVVTARSKCGQAGKASVGQKPARATEGMS